MKETKCPLCKGTGLGQAALCYAKGIPSVFRSGWNLLTEEEQQKANIQIDFMDSFMDCRNCHGTGKIEPTPRTEITQILPKRKRAARQKRNVVKGLQNEKVVKLRQNSLHNYTL